MDPNELARRAIAAAERSDRRMSSAGLLNERINEGKVIPVPCTNGHADAWGVALLLDGGYTEPPDEDLLEFWRQTIRNSRA